MKTEFKLPKHIDKFLKEKAEEEEAFNKEFKRKAYWTKLGVVGVDSGQLMICDPCYIESQWEKKEFVPEGKADQSFSYNGACFRSKKDTGRYGNQMNYEMGHAGVGVSFNTGYGDGTYEIWGKIKHCRVIELRIKMG